MAFLLMSDARALHPPNKTTKITKWDLKRETIDMMERTDV